MILMVTSSLLDLIMRMVGRFHLQYQQYVYGYDMPTVNPTDKSKTLRLTNSEALQAFRLYHHGGQRGQQQRRT